MFTDVKLMFPHQKHKFSVRKHKLPFGIIIFLAYVN